MSDAHARPLTSLDYNRNPTTKDGPARDLS
jgi:hypothetical protein